MTRDIPLRRPRVGGRYTVAELEKLAHAERDKEIARLDAEEAAVREAEEKLHADADVGDAPHED